MCNIKSIVHRNNPIYFSYSKNVTQSLYESIDVPHKCVLKPKAIGQTGDDKILKVKFGFSEMSEFDQFYHNRLTFTAN